MFSAHVVANATRHLCSTGPEPWRNQSPRGSASTVHTGSVANSISGVIFGAPSDFAAAGGVVLSLLGCAGFAFSGRPSFLHPRAESANTRNGLIRMHRY